MSAAPSPDHTAQLRAALGALQKQSARIAELEAASAAAPESIAIIGLGCRFPGGAHGPDAFWAKLRAGFDAVREVPPERWPVDAHYDADPETAGKIYTRHGAFLDDVDKFDARFFNISPREAATMDPQQRLLLETAWETFEHAGLPPEKIAGSATGVFVGLTCIDYLKLIYRDDLRRLDTYCATGNIANIAAGRLSYFFGLRGPSLTLDTACSSSLVAIHLACQSLRTGESTLALAAGVNLILAPDNSVAVSRARMLAPDGRCKTFDAAADGYARGEGCGVLLLKRLSLARADGNRILGVIRGTAVAQDGARAGLTVPHGPAQTALLRAALASAGIAPAEVGYVEAHGTGTALGDPIEAEALAGVFGRDADRRTPLVLGSLKTNVGHMESAAGVGGVIKAVLALQHGEIPPHLHFTREHPELHLADIPAVVPVRLQPWPAVHARRIAGVSSFGSSGTIAHVVLEAPPAEPAAANTSEWPAALHTLILSAKSPAALDRLAARYADFLRALPPGVTVADVCHTAAVGRTRFAHTRVVTGRTAAELADKVGQVSDLPSGAQASAMPPPPLARLVTLPTYPFERERHWVDPEPRVTASPAPALTAAPVRPPPPADALQFGIMFFNGSETPGGDSYRMVFDAARFADAHGFSSVWVPERHFTSFGSLYPNPATLHAALARETRSVRLMAGSSVLPLHNLLRLVEEWSMVDNFSHGRAGMSFASGWNPGDFALAPDHYAGRQEELFRGIAEAQRLWRGETTRVRGGDGREIDVRIYPTPVQPELPLWVTAAGNPRTFERAGEIGANLLTHLLDQGPDELAEKISRYRAARARAGHDPAAGRVTVMLHTFLGADAAGVHAKVRGPYTRYLRDNLHLLRGLAASRGRDVDPASLPEKERAAFVEFLYDRFAATRALLGTPESCAPLARQLAAAGVSEIACLLDFGPTTEDVLAMLPQLDVFKNALAGTRVALGAAAARVSVEVAKRAPECFHEVAWHRVSLVPKLPLPSAPQRWLLLADSGGAARALAARLRDLGQNVSVFSPGETLPDADARIVNLRPLDADAALAETLPLFRREHGRVWTVTRGAQPAGEVAPSPLAAAHWGLLRAMPVEQPQRWGGLVDLDPALPAAAQVDPLLLAITTSSREDQLAVRGDSIFAARLFERRTAGLARSAPWRPRADATCLVTGGLGGVGFAVARWLASLGARHLLLLGRRGPDEARRADLAALESAGVKVAVAAVDLGDAASLNAALAAHRAAGGPPVRAVFHAAGAWADCALAGLTPASLAETWRAKAGGAAHLDAAFRGEPLDAFVLFSAFSAVLPAPTQGNYAAANAFLGALARQRRARGEPALCLDWGPWSEIGFAATDYGRRAHAQLEKLGITRFRPADGLAVLARALASDATQLAAMSVDWTKLFAADPLAKLSPLLGELLAAHAPSAPPAADSGRIARTLAGRPAAAQLALLTDELRALVAEVLRMDVADLPAATPLSELGVDSLVAIEIKNRLQRDAGVDVPLTQLLSGPTTASLAAALLGQVKMAALAAATTGGAVEEIEI